MKAAAAKRGKEAFTLPLFGTGFCALRPLHKCYKEAFCVDEGKEIGLQEDAPEGSLAHRPAPLCH